MKLRHFLVALSFAAPLAAPLAGVAQDYERPPGSFADDPPPYSREPAYNGGGSGPGGNYGGGGGGAYGGGGESSDPASVGMRVGKLESRIREMTGQIEELQNANRKLVEQLQKFQADVDSRMSSRGRRSESAPSSVSSNDSPTASVDGATPRVGGKAKRGDAFDPDATGDAPGKPKPLGSTASAEEAGSDAPMDLSGGRLRRGQADSDTLAPTLRLPSATPKTAGGTTKPDGTVVANIAPASPRAEFDVALGMYKDKQYEDAEKGFSAFIQKNPKSKLAADATYYLGESFTQRGRAREAAEQYLKVSTEYGSSNRAPDAMLRLGVSLKSLGAKEQACATFSEVARKYPNAPAYVKSGAERELKRAQC